MNVFELFGKIRLDGQKDVQRELKNTEKIAGETGKSFEEMGKKAEKAGKAMMGAGLVLGGILIAMTKSAADFDMNMREVNTMINLSSEEFENLKDQVQEVSLEVGKSTEELSGALYQAVSAGIPAGEAIEFLGIAGKLAVAGVTDTETAVDGLTTIINAFGISAGEAEAIADVLFTTARLGKTDISQLSTSMFQVAPMASAAGIKFEEVAAAIATMSKQGVPTSVVTRQLRQAISSIIKPTDQMADAIENAGYESGQTLLAELGLAGALNVLTEEAGGSQEKMGEMFGSVEALGAVLSLTGENAETFAEDIATTSEDAAGAVEVAYGIMNEGIGKQFEDLFNSIKIMGEDIGEALLPIFQQIVEKMQPIVEKFIEWVNANEELFPILWKVSVILIGAGGVVFALGKALLVLRGLIVAMTIFQALASPAKLLLGLAAAAAGVLALKWIMPSSDEITPMEPPIDLEPAPLMDTGGLVRGPGVFRVGEGVKEIVRSPGSRGELHVHIGNFMGDETSRRKFIRELQSMMREDDRRTAFGQVGEGYFFGRSAP